MSRESNSRPWHWRSLPLQQRTGSDVFEQLFRSPFFSGIGAIATLLESPATYSPYESGQPYPQSRYSICAGAPRRDGDQWRIWTPSLGHILPTLQHLRHADSDIPDANLPFTGGWLGWLGYDLAWEIERLPWRREDQLPFPVAYWYEPENFAVLDHWQQQIWIATTDPQAGDRLQHQLETSLPNPILSLPQMGRASYATQANDYQAAVRRAQQYIQAGDIFQTNLSLRFATAGFADPWQLYRTLHQINPSPFASYWQTPWGAVISCSPERLVHRVGRQAQTRPIAGTRPRGTTPESDRRYEQELLSNAKENAEHIMLVDLERNDLGRVCDWGTVEVDELLTIERYSHVMHLVSNVRGMVSPDIDAIALIRALFPGGTITGCPKVRCMDIIEELEPVRRSLFYGSCGYLDWRGHLDLNILIRTLLAVPDEPFITGAQPFHIYGQVGAGIVADSDPGLEWEESLQKAKAQLAVLSG
ncbi:MAG: anthranilate synthase component I [Leptolyngbya sp. DLM2.Bin15]|nr:MAG: anthranilate synthase component I [Leptolyngbya sp. DLM2.Bin15]